MKKENNNYRVYSTEVFHDSLLKIARKYPSVVSIVDDLFGKFERGELGGNVVPRLKIKGGRVFKTRLGNPDANKGKSGGFRVIWYLITSENDIYPLTIYSKSDQEDISLKEINMLIKKVR